MQVNSTRREKATSLRNATWTAQDQDTDQQTSMRQNIRKLRLILESNDLATIKVLAAQALDEELSQLKAEEQDVINHALIEAAAQRLIDDLLQEEANATRTPVADHPATQPVAA